MNDYNRLPCNIQGVSMWPAKNLDAVVRYEFPWGRIVERRVNQVVIWDYCLSHLLQRYLQAGKRLEDCQQQVFKALEATFSCTSRDLLVFFGLTDAWQLSPYSAMGVFSQVIHFTAEHAARDWVIKELLVVMPAIIASAERSLTNASSG
jgi:hypothetical protein